MTDKIIRRKRSLRIKRKLRIRARVFGDATTPRLSIFRSNRYFYAQVIGDVKGITLTSVDGKKLGLKIIKMMLRKLHLLWLYHLKKSM